MSEHSAADWRVEVFNLYQWRVHGDLSLVLYLINMFLKYIAKIPKLNFIQGLLKNKLIGFIALKWLMIVKEWQNHDISLIINRILKI